MLHVMCLGSPYHMVLELMLKLCLDNFLMTSLSSLVYMYYFDNPGGMIPSWLVNWAAKVSKAWWCNYLCLLCLNNLFTASKPVFCMLSRIYVCKYVYVDIYTCIYIFFSEMDAFIFLALRQFCFSRDMLLSALLRATVLIFFDSYLILWSS